MRSNSTIDEYNKRLSDIYGKDIGSNQPRYKIVWSSDQTEIRKGTYHDFNGDIYLRTVTEVRQTEKYPLFSDMWVLEALQGNDNNTELPAKFSYEPLWVFGANRSVPMPVWDKVDQMVQAHRFVMRRIKTPSDLQEEEDKRFLKEVQDHKTIIKDAGNAFAGAMKAGEAVTVLSDHNQPMEKK